MRVRVLHVVETMRGMGGMEKGIVNLSRTLPSDRFEHVVCVIRSVGPLVNQFDQSVKVVALNAENSRSQAGMLVRLIRSVRPDVVHSRNWGAIEAVFAARWARVGLVIHSEHGLETSNALQDPWRRRVIRRLAFEAAGRVFCVSEDLRRIHHVRTGFPLRRIGVIHNGVDTRRFRPDPERRAFMRSRLGVGPHDFCIGAVGRLEPVKDIPTLVRAVRRFARTNASWHLLLAGDGSEMANLRRSAEQQPELRGRVHLLGDIDDVPAFLNSLDVYVVSSLFEGICNSLLEAMMAGVPAVASAVGGNVEVVEDGVSGLLFPAGGDAALAEHLESLWRDAQLRTGLADSALRRVANEFSLHSMAAHYARLYSSVAAREPHTPTVSSRPAHGASGNDNRG